MAGRVKKEAIIKKHPLIPAGEVFHDKVTNIKWRIGPPLGSGGFGMIYLACDHGSSSKKFTDYPFVLKIEPHDSGSLFVEKLFYIRNATSCDIAEYKKSKKLLTFGMPLYLGSGSHEYNGQKFRYLVMERYGKDVWSLFKEADYAFRPATVFQIGLQLLDVLEYIHSRRYVHADIKGTNIVIGFKKGTENQIYLIDFGLASRVINKEFKPNKKCAHNGTIEYTSRDAHLGVPTMRGDLEILAYNMLQWLIGELPWEKLVKSPQTVQKMKEDFMTNINNIKKSYPNVPDAIIKLLEYINSLKPLDTVDYTKVRPIFNNYLKSLNIRSNKLDFSKAPSNSTSVATSDAAANPLDGSKATKRNIPKNKIQNGATKLRVGVKRFSETNEENCENQEPVSECSPPPSKRRCIIVEREVLAKAKTAKTSCPVTPPPTKNYIDMGTQTDFEKLERPRRSTRQLPKKNSYKIPISKIVINNNIDKTENEESSSSSSYDTREETPRQSRVKRRKIE